MFHASVNSGCDLSSAEKVCSASSNSPAPICSAPLLSAASAPRSPERCQCSHLGCHGTVCGTYSTPEAGFPVRTLRGALWARYSVSPLRTVHGRQVRVARTDSSEAPGRTCQLRLPQQALRDLGKWALLQRSQQERLRLVHRGEDRRTSQRFHHHLECWRGEWRSGG